MLYALWYIKHTHLKSNIPTNYHSQLLYKENIAFPSAVAPACKLYTPLEMQIIYNGLVKDFLSRISGRPIKYFMFTSICAHNNLNKMKR